MTWEYNRYGEIKTNEEMNLNRHTMHRLTLRDGSMWAVDLAGAQLGQTRTLMPWAEYIKDNTYSVDSFAPIGDCLERVRRTYTPLGIISAGGSEVDAARGLAWLDLGRVFGRGLLVGMQREGVTASELLTNTSANEFQRICGVLMRQACEYGEDFKAKWAAKGGLAQVVDRSVLTLG